MHDNELMGGGFGPLEKAKMAAKAVCLGEALKPEFRAYAAQVLTNARVLAATLLDNPTITSTAPQEGAADVEWTSSVDLSLVSLFNIYASATPITDVSGLVPVGFAARTRTAGRPGHWVGSR